MLGESQHSHTGSWPRFTGTITIAVRFAVRVARRYRNLQDCLKGLLFHPEPPASHCSDTVAAWTGRRRTGVSRKDMGTLVYHVMGTGRPQKTFHPELPPGHRLAEGNGCVGLFTMKLPGRKDIAPFSLAP